MIAPHHLRVAPEPRGPRLTIVLAGAGLVLAALAVYANSLSGPFIFDDFLSIPQNPTLRSFFTALHPPGGGVTVTGRPFLNLSFALNHALSGDHVWSYHALNLLIHVLAGLTLFGIVRRTLTGWGTAQSGPRAPVARLSGNEAMLVAFTTALLWLVHPLQTESVTYIVQRAESLMSLCYLLTVYGFLRGAETGGTGRWFGLSFFACLFGMATKEVMVSAPVIVLLYDRTFLSGGFRAAWRRHGRVHLALAATWILLAASVLSAANRGGSAGFGVGVGFWTYVATQFQAVTHYLLLSVWPHPLIIDYGVEWPASVWEVIPYATGIALLLAATVVALIRRPALGFLGAVFFALLAPSSLVPVVRQTLAEHRMYLALAPVLFLLVLALRPAFDRRGWIVVVAVVLGFGGLTVHRNTDYRSSATIWRDTVTKRPHNAAAHNNYGNLLALSGEFDRALAQFEEAIRLDPCYADTYYNAGNVLKQLGRPAESNTRYEQALRLRPDDAAVLNALGLALAQSGRLPEAVARFEEALRLRPDFAEAHRNLGRLLAATERLPEAIAHLEQAAKISPTLANVQDSLGMALVMANRAAAAIPHFEAALRLNPDQAQAHLNLAIALDNAGRAAEAAAQYEAARRMGLAMPPPGQ